MQKLKIRVFSDYEYSLYFRSARLYDRLNICNGRYLSTDTRIVHLILT